MDLTELLIVSIKTLLIYVAFIHVVPVMIWVERKGAALIQDRPGPNRVGPFGLLQPVADAVKFLFKEDPVPTEVNRLLYNLGPFLILLPSSVIIAAIPIGDHVHLFGRDILLQVADIDVALLFFLSISSLGVYGILFGGWASNNKYSLLGAMRSTSQVISYEIPIALCAANAVMFYGTFSLREIVLQQEGLVFGFLPNWGIWFQPVGFLVFFIALFAETNRLPFDLPESEAELVGGYHTEYGSMKFATFFMAEYINLATASALLVTLFFGGWHVPWISDSLLLLKLGSQNLVALVQVSMFVAKVSVLLCIFVWVRWTVPRFRFDQLMHLAWGNLIPLGIFNIIVTAIALYLIEGR